jgi:hypothetical protein
MCCSAVVDVALLIPFGGRTPAEAVHAFLEPLNRAISCVTSAVLTVSGGYYEADEPHALVLGDGPPEPLDGDGDLSLTVRQRYRIVEFEGGLGPWKVTTAGYSYVILTEGLELLVFHCPPRWG